MKKIKKFYSLIILYWYGLLCGGGMDHISSLWLKTLRQLVNPLTSDDSIFFYIDQATLVCCFKFFPVSLLIWVFMLLKVFFTIVFVFYRFSPSHRLKYNGIFLDFLACIDIYSKFAVSCCIWWCSDCWNSWNFFCHYVFHR